MPSKVIIPKDLIVDTKKMKRAITNALNGAAKGARVDFNVTTRTWGHRPEFAISSPEPYVREVSTDDPIYTMLNEGTKPHDIAPRPGGVLRFQTPFRSKTIPRDIRSRKGATGKNVVWTRRKVRHPGTKAREWDEVIRIKWEKQLPIIMQRAIDATVQ